MSLFNEGDLMI